MRNIIIEGVDGTGKTYIAKVLSEIFDMPIHWPGGPPKNLSEMLLRLHEQFEFRGMIFDRVTAISEACYRENLSIDFAGILRTCRQEMYRQNNLFIYCNNIIGEDDSGYQDAAHQKSVKRRFEKIRLNYDLIFKDLPHLEYKAKITDINDLIAIIKQEI